MLTNLPRQGFSDEARVIERLTDEQRDSFESTATFGKQSVIDELAIVWEECRHPNWDGHQAVAILGDTVCNARLLLESLAWGLPVPTIGAEPDGQLTFEWHHSARRTLSVSVTSDGYLHYAALLGPNREFGTVAFFDELPDDILRLIHRVTDE